MKYNIIVRPEAQLDLDEAFGWYKKQLTGLGHELIHCIDASLSLIQRNPKLFPIIYKNIHRTVIRRFPYCIFYLIHSEKIIVISIFHANRNPRSWKERIKH